MVGMAVATTVDSMEAKNRLSMIPTVTKTIRFRDIYYLSSVNRINFGWYRVWQSYLRKQVTERFHCKGLRSLLTMSYIHCFPFSSNSLISWRESQFAVPNVGASDSSRMVCLSVETSTWTTCDLPDSGQ